MTSSHDPKFVVLTILDGWGIATEGEGNAIKLANTPNMDKFLEEYPNTTLEAAGQAVGLPRGEDGNTETGHLNIGAGRIVYQDLERINMSIAEGDFFSNPVFIKAIDHVNKNHSDLHLMGLVGAGGVHSDLSHLFGLIRLASSKKVENLYIHVFTDGRDSPPTSAMTYINKLQEVLDRESKGKIASIMGRYWSMDRDMRWERTQKAYKALTEGSDITSDNIFEAIENSYHDGVTDEFIDPITITEDGKPVGLIKDNDAVIFINFRVDRPRQLTKAFVMDDFSKAGNKHDFDPFRIKYEKTHRVQEVDSSKPFNRGKKLENLLFVTMTEYSSSLVKEGAIPAYPPQIVKGTLGEILSKNKRSQLRVTETEKERFVTFYFNGMQEGPFDGEERMIIPSPNVPTYDEKPEMSSDELTSRLIEKIRDNDYSLIVINYPNPDMVAHTGDLNATIKAVETVDKYLGELYEVVKEKKGMLLITGDHGNAEELIDPETNEMNTEHSANKVPLIAVFEDYKRDAINFSEGILADIAPTILAIMNIDKPEKMTGRNLLSISSD